MAFLSPTSQVWSPSFPIQTPHLWSTDSFVHGSWARRGALPGSSAQLRHPVTLSFVSAHLHQPSVAASASSLCLLLVHDTKTLSVSLVLVSFHSLRQQMFPEHAFCKRRGFSKHLARLFTWFSNCLPSHLAFLISLYILIISKNYRASFWD